MTHFWVWVTILAWPVIVIGFCIWGVHHESKLIASGKWRREG